MRLLILALFLLAGVAVGYPLLNENTNDLCDAAERRIVSAAAGEGTDRPNAALLGMLQKSNANGTLIRSLVQQYAPGLPIDVACAAVYWRVVVDPEEARALLGGLFRTRRAAASHPPARAALARPVAGQARHGLAIPVQPSHRMAAGAG